MRHAGICAFIVCTALVIARPAAADVVSDWNICAPSIIAAGRASVVFGAVWTGFGIRTALVAFAVALVAAAFAAAGLFARTRRVRVA